MRQAEITHQLIDGLVACMLMLTDKLSASEVKALYESNADTNAYTDTEKTKLTGIKVQAQKNVQSDWTNQAILKADDYIKNKPAIPTKVSDLTNDTGYITGYTETDPTPTAWNKSTGISITKSQVSLIEANTITIWLNECNRQTKT